MAKHNLVNIVAIYGCKARLVKTPIRLESDHCPSPAGSDNISA
jgi:hypothetical protein